MSDKQSKQFEQTLGYEDFLETELYADYDPLFKESKKSAKQLKAKSKKNARRRVEDYLERKAIKHKIDDWNHLL